MNQGFNASQIPHATQVQPQKKKINLAIIITAILSLMIGAGIVYFIMSNQKADADLNLSRVESKVKKFEAIIPAGLDIDKLDAGENPNPGDQVGESRVVHLVQLTSEETLNALTITALREVGSDEYTGVNDILAPQIRVIDGDWAKTYALFIQKTKDGYIVPPVGITELIWNKVNGQWKKVAECGDVGPCNPDNLNAIPLSIISLEERTS